MLGIFWSMFQPFLMLTVYTLVFSLIFKARWSSAGESKTEFALILFAGLMIYTLFADCTNRAPSLILQNVNYVKKVVFPLEILPWVSLGASLFHFLASLVIWLIAYCLFYGTPHATTLLLPFALIPIMLLTMGTSWILASLGVYLRDVTQLVGLLTTALMFLSPIFYPPSAIPSDFQWVLALNPISPSIELARDLLFWGKTPQWSSWIVYTSLTALFAYCGFFWFQKTRSGFADVL
jgi:lipopolysaccharide transport system permease protein